MFVKDNFTGDLVDGWKRALSESSFEQVRGGEGGGGGGKNCVVYNLKKGQSRNLKTEA